MQPIPSIYTRYVQRGAEVTVVRADANVHAVTIADVATAVFFSASTLSIDRLDLQITVDAPCAIVFESGGAGLFEGRGIAWLNISASDPTQALASMRAVIRWGGGPPVHKAVRAATSLRPKTSFGASSPRCLKPSTALFKLFALDAKLQVIFSQGESAGATSTFVLHKSEAGLP